MKARGAESDDRRFRLLRHPGGGAPYSILAAAILLCFGLQLHLAFAQPINWDEFRFLADVHAHRRGELSAALLTFQVHFFGWVAGIGSEADQIVAARLVMLGFEAGTMALILTMARRFATLPAAMLAVLGYISFSYVLQHGASFRFDPIVTFFSMMPAALLLRDRLQPAHMMAAGLSLAVAAMVTPKAVFVLPLVASLGLYRLIAASDRRRTFALLALGAVSAAAFLAVLYLLHVNSLAAATAQETQAHLGESYARTLGETPLLPQAMFLTRAVLENPLNWFLLAIGVVTAVGNVVRGGDRARSLLLLAFLFPLASILVYRNAFPYYYAYVLAPAVVLIAVAADRVELRRHLWVPAFLLAAATIFHHQQALSIASTNQRRTIEAVHAIFPTPVSYLDRSSMIATFPQVGLFLSTLVVDPYLQAGRPIMRDLVLKEQPVFVVANSTLLSDAFSEDSRGRDNRRLLPGDRAVLRENFVHHWGSVFVAGKAMTASTRDVRFEILVAGRYTIESSAPIVLDGAVFEPASTVILDRGNHVIRSPEGGQAVVLRWGDHLTRPDSPAPDGPMFGRF